MLQSNPLTLKDFPNDVDVIDIEWRMYFADKLVANSSLVEKPKFPRTATH